MNDSLDSISTKVKLRSVSDDKEFDEAWSDFVQELVWQLKNSKKKRDSNIIKSTVGLIHSDAISKEDLQNIGRGDYESFKKDLSAKGVPDAICDLLFEKYVVVATAMEAIGKYAFLKEVKWLIDEEMPSLKKQEFFLDFLIW